MVIIYSKVMNRQDPESIQRPAVRRKEAGAKHLEELRDLVSLLPSSICDEAKEAVEGSLDTGELDPELRGRLYIACTYFFLHLVQRHLELALPDEEAKRLSTMLLKETGRKGYHTFFAQDIVPREIVEYFYTFFESNFTACTRYLGSFAMTPGKGAGNTRDVCAGFSSWLKASLEDCPEIDSMPTRLWEAWTTKEPFERFRLLTLGA